MINKRLINTVSESKKFIAGNVLCQWLSLLANIVLLWTITDFTALLFTKAVYLHDWLLTLAICALAALIKSAMTITAARMSFLSGKAVKIKLRKMIYEKLLRLGSAYREKVQTAEVVQVAVEGAEQLETYFGAYLPQFFYALLAPLTLFTVLSFVNLPSALILLFCVPLIPVSIAAVQTWAKKLLAKYWDKYLGLGDTFLENLQGLTTLKIYQADERKHRQMNEEAESFRKITMKVLTMQLNSITLMDLVAYGGAAGGIITAIIQFMRGNVALNGCLLIILLSADFFIPMRLLGSYFHVAMNGVAAADKIFNILNLAEEPAKTLTTNSDYALNLQNVSFSYDESRTILKEINMKFPSGSFTAIVGKSSSGKSTVAGLLMGRNRGYTGSITLGNIELKQIAEESLMKTFTYISHHSYLFKGTVRSNLLIAKAQASDDEMQAVLKRVKIGDFFAHAQGLDTLINENGTNLSGGQCQRLALARAILHDSPIYIFDEATSNIDVRSENDIMAEIQALAQTKTVIMISHRLANSIHADNIYVMQEGRVAEEGTHGELLAKNGLYKELWDAQYELEQYIGEA